MGAAGRVSSSSLLLSAMARDTNVSGLRGCTSSSESFNASVTVFKAAGADTVAGAAGLLVRAATGFAAVSAGAAARATAAVSAGLASAGASCCSSSDSCRLLTSSGICLASRAADALAALFVVLTALPNRVR